MNRRFYFTPYINQPDGSTFSQISEVTTLENVRNSTGIFGYFFHTFDICMCDAIKPEWLLEIRGDDVYCQMIPDITKEEMVDYPLDNPIRIGGKDLVDAILNSKYGEIDVAKITSQECFEHIYLRALVEPQGKIFPFDKVPHLVTAAIYNPEGESIFAIIHPEYKAGENPLWFTIHLAPEEFVAKMSDFKYLGKYRG